MANNAKNLEEIQSAINQGGSLAREMAGRDEKHLRWALGVKVVLLAFVAIYLGWAYSNFRLVDADLFVITAQQKFYDALPEAKARMAQQLKRIAPAVVDQAGEEMIKTIPRMEKQIETSAQRALLEWTDPLQKDITTWLSSFIQETKAALDDTFPAMSSFDKITRLRQYVMEDFRDVLKGIGDEIGDALGGHSFGQRLRRLVAGKNLTEKEKLERDILAIWSVLIRNKVAEIDLKGLSTLESILTMDVFEEAAKPTR
jgi:hypothetical protein